MKQMVQNLHILATQLAAPPESTLQVNGRGIFRICMRDLGLMSDVTDATRRDWLQR